jgi:methyl-accepting chemotaxis protein
LCSTAAQTAKATSKISGRIAGMLAATPASVSAIKEIGARVGRISQIATTIASAVRTRTRVMRIGLLSVTNWAAGRSWHAAARATVDLLFRLFCAFVYSTCVAG